jgi:hypothetical protein
LAALETRREDILGPLVAKYHGRVFKVTNDGDLAFPCPCRKPNPACPAGQSILSRCVDLAAVFA